MSNSKAIIVAVVFYLVVCGIGLAYDVPNPNLNNDGRVDFADFGILAINWLQSGAGLAGDFDDSNTVDIEDLMVFSWYWLQEYSEYQQCQNEGADLDSDGIIAFEDMAILAQNWLMTSGGLAGDFDDSNLVDYNDLWVLTDCWLIGTRPELVIDSLKDALAVPDVEKALTYFIDFAVDNYRAIFNENIGELQNLANNMGDLTLEYRDRDIAVYEISNATSTKFYPVVFVLDDDGTWKIVVF
jgi:hypothetical protein